MTLLPEAVLSPPTSSPSCVHPPETPRRPGHSDYEPPEGGPYQRSSRSGIRGGNLAQTFRHSGWYATRARVYTALRDISTSDPVLKAFEKCGSHAYVLRSDTDPPRYKAAGSACHHRLCLPCAQARSQTIALNVLSHLGSSPVRFLTLTIRHDHPSLTDAIDHLYDSFARLLRQPWWQKRVTGGVAFLEVPRSTEQPAWHPHLHVLVTGAFLPKPDLREQWAACTRGSYVLDISLVRDHGKVAQYVTKYASKPLHGTITRDVTLIAELACALHGRRLLRTFGTWRAYRLTEPPQDDSWTNVGSLTDYIQAAADGDERARAILRKIDGDLADSVIADCVPQPRPPPLRCSTPSQSLLQFEGRGRW